MSYEFWVCSSGFRVSYEFKIMSYEFGFWSMKFRIWSFKYLAGGLELTDIN